jgi:hypothetical protein
MDYARDVLSVLPFWMRAALVLAVLALVWSVNRAVDAVRAARRSRPVLLAALKADQATGARRRRLQNLQRLIAKAERRRHA